MLCDQSGVIGFERASLLVSTPCYMCTYPLFNEMTMPQRTNPTTGAAAVFPRDVLSFFPENKSLCILG